MPDCGRLFNDMFAEGADSTFIADSVLVNPGDVLNLTIEGNPRYGDCLSILESEPGADHWVLTWLVYDADSPHPPRRVPDAFCTMAGRAGDSADFRLPDELLHDRLIVVCNSAGPGPEQASWTLAELTDQPCMRLYVD